MGQLFWLELQSYSRTVADDGVCFGGKGLIAS